MSIFDIFRNASGELIAAAGGTLLVWLAFARLYPNERLDLAETTLVLVCLFALCKAVGLIVRRARGHAERR